MLGINYNLDFNMTEKISKYIFIFIDILSLILSYSLILDFVLHKKIEISILNSSQNLYLDGLVYVLFWMLIFYIQGSYLNVNRKSRLQELTRTISASLIGSTIIFLLLLTDQLFIKNEDFYVLYYVIFLTHLLNSSILRILFINLIIWQIRNGKIKFNTLIAGSNGKALSTLNKLENSEKNLGYNIIGFISVVKEPSSKLKYKLTDLGTPVDVEKIITEYNVDEIIIATEKKETKEVGRIIAEAARKNIIVKIIPDLYDFFVGSVGLSHRYDLPLIEVNHLSMPNWQFNVKRLIDIVFSIIALILLIPVFIFLGFMVKFSSKGPVFYSHERIGRYGKPFNIYKFRSMYVDAEKNGPALAYESDPRITPFGRFLRKSRLDETPQFFNVLIGDMSLVGPRPERQYYIDKIVKRAPHYFKLQSIRPGITSWGQVKYGYAENVDQMIERLDFDLAYLDTISLYTDFKILINTFFIMLKGDGR